MLGENKTDQCELKMSVGHNDDDNICKNDK